MNECAPQRRFEIYLKEAVSFLAGLVGIPTFLREILLRNKATIISYHDPGPKVFRSHLRYLAAHYNIISLDKLVSAVRGESGWDTLPQKALVITIDDGFSGNYDLIPILDEFDIPVIIFARPDGLKDSGPGADKFLSKYKILELLRHRVSFGGHSMTHAYLSTLSYDEASGEIIESKRYLEKELLITISHFSYPYGDYSKREKDIVRGASGYLSARTVKPGWVDNPSDPYELRCMGVGDNSGINKMMLEVTGIFPFLRIVRRKFFTYYFDKYRPPITYITGLLNLRGPIAQHTAKQAELIQKYARGKKRLVEIGVSEGGSAMLALSVMDPKGRMWLIDPYRSIFYPFFSLSLKIAKRALRRFKGMDIALLRDYSFNVAKKWDTKIDYLLLDARHSEDSFLKDWNDWSRFLSDDGVILVQSTQSPDGHETGSGKAVRRLFEKPDSEWKIIDEADATIALRRRCEDTL